MKSVLCLLSVLLIGVEFSSSAQIGISSGVTIRPSSVNIANEDFKVVCRFWSTTFYRVGFKPEYIDEKLCTHVVYNVAVLDPTTLTIRVDDPLIDIDKKFYQRITNLKKKGIRVSISVLEVSGTNEDIYSQIGRSASARLTFVASAVEFLQTHDFDGLELFWIYPVCDWRGKCSSGCSDEKHLFTDLVRELSAAFKLRGLLLSAFLTAKPNVRDAGYDIPELSKHVDWISIQGYNYMNNQDDYATHFASFQDFKISIGEWIRRGAQPRKMVMGLPAFGRRRILKDKQIHDFGARVIDQNYTFLPFIEIKDIVNNNSYSVVHDDSVGTYTFSGSDWISYNDVRDIQRKSEYIREKGLGGAMISEIGWDDFQGDFFCGTFPLSAAVNKILRNVSYADTELRDCT